MTTRFRKPSLVLVILASFMSIGSSLARAQEGSLLRSAVKETIDVLTTQAEKQGSKTVVKELADFGGESAVREVFEQVGKEGGENGVKAVVALTRDYGIDAILAAKASPRVTATYVERLSPTLVPGALRALARTADRTVIERLEAELMPAALEASARHPGIGAQLVEKLGVAGERASQRYDTDAVLQLVRSNEADLISAMPAVEKTRLTTAIADFIEAHPKTVLGATGVGLFVAYKDELLGGKGKIVIGSNGEPIYVPEIGMIERVVYHVLDWVLPVVAAIVGLWGVNRLFWTWKRSRLSYHTEAAARVGSGSDTKLNN